MIFEVVAVVAVKKNGKDFTFVCWCGRSVECWRGRRVAATGGGDRGGSGRARSDGLAGGETRRADGLLRTGREARFGGGESDGQLWGC